MDAKEFARWVREEHERVEELSHQLQESVAARPRRNLEGWLPGFVERFDHLRAHLQKHMALEEQDGYLRIVVERRPMFTDRVARLRHEHAEMTHLMRRLREDLNSVGPDDHLLVRDLCVRVENLLIALEHHEQAENLLMMSIFTDDIGEKD